MKQEHLHARENKLWHIAVNPGISNGITQAQEVYQNKRI